MNSTSLRALALALLTLSGGVAVADSNENAAGLGGPADWVAIDLERIAFGRGPDVQVVSRQSHFEPLHALHLDGRVTGGVVAGRRLYLVQEIRGVDSLIEFALDDPGARPTGVPLRPAAAGRLHVTQMDDYVLVAEDGYGLRVLQLAVHRHAGGHHIEPPRQVGWLPWSLRVDALASSLRTAYAASGSEILVVDLGNPAEPRIERSVAVGTPALALAANGATLHLLGEDGLHVLDLTGREELRRVAFDPGVRGRGLVAAGRELHLAAGDAGLRVIQDQVLSKAKFFVQVGDTFFDPTSVSILVGDTVSWQKGSTSFTHNVRSCTAAQLGCEGEVATESFTSGGVTTAPFDLSHVFVSVGTNPFVCQTHAFTMTGTVTVAAATSPPPAVPDGTGAGAEPPMTVDKLTVDGSDLRLVYDTSCIDAADHDIVFGTGAQFPAAPGGVFGVAGSRCGIGSVVPFGWIGSPAALADDFVWWVIVADDGEGIEGSWGKDGGGAERVGPGANGSSAQCGNADKDLTNTCGQ